MKAGLLVDGVDHVERALDFLAFVQLGIDPDGEELGAQVASLDLVEVEVAGAGVLREVEVLVDEAAGGVGVGVDDERRVVDGARAGGGAVRRDRFGWRLFGRGIGILGNSERREEQDSDEQARQTHEGDLAPIRTKGSGLIVNEGETAGLALEITVARALKVQGPDAALSAKRGGSANSG